MPRRRQSIRFDLRMECYEKLLELQRVRSDGTPEPLIGVVERLIEMAAEQGALSFVENEFVRGVPHRVNCVR